MKLKESIEEINNSKKLDEYGEKIIEILLHYKDKNYLDNGVFQDLQSTINRIRIIGMKVSKR